jgi:hypothetical protein
MPQPTFTQVTADSKLIGYVDKRYREEMKFSGNLYDVLNTRLLAFYDICRKVALPKEQWHDAYSIILAGRALDFYYDRLSNRGYDFDTMVGITRVHFERQKRIVNFTGQNGEQQPSLV